MKGKRSSSSIEFQLVLKEGTHQYCSKSLPFCRNVQPNSEARLLLSVSASIGPSNSSHPPEAAKASSRRTRKRTQRQQPQAAGANHTRGLHRTRLLDWLDVLPHLSYSRRHLAKQRDKKLNVSIQQSRQPFTLPFGIMPSHC